MNVVPVVQVPHAYAHMYVMYVCSMYVPPVHMYIYLYMLYIHDWIQEETVEIPYH
jgi:hypothetical protein